MSRLSIPKKKLIITVGIRQLKTKLSEYLRDVKRGKSIVITVKGQVVALLLPAENHYDVEIARELTRKGIGTWKGGKPKGASRPVVIKGKPLSQVIIEERRYSAYFLENGWNDWNGWNV